MYTGSKTVVRTVYDNGFEVKAGMHQDSAMSPLLCRMHKIDIGVNANLELVDKLCYLGDMLSVDGGADAAVETRIQIGWNKLRQLVQLLTNKDISLIVRGRLYSSPVQSSTGSKGLREKQGLDDIISVLQRNRL